MPRKSVGLLFGQDVPYREGRSQEANMLRSKLLLHSKRPPVPETVAHQRALVHRNSLNLGLARKLYCGR